MFNFDSEALNFHGEYQSVAISSDRQHPITAHQPWQHESIDSSSIATRSTKNHQTTGKHQFHLPYLDFYTIPSTIITY
jgi:hypothetical protein